MKFYYGWLEIGKPIYYISHTDYTENNAEI